MKHLTMTRGTNRVAWTGAVITIALCVGVGAAQARVVLASRGPSYHRAPSTLEMVFEAGLAQPQGDQQDDFWTTDQGFSSETGYQLGLRLRHYLGENLAVAPVIQYLRFGTASGVTDYNGQADLGYRVRTSNYRFGLDFNQFLGDPAAIVRPFLTGGIALINNRYRDEIEFEGAYEASVNAPAYSLGGGLRSRNLELTVEYTFDRFDTNKFDFAEQTRDYNWDYLIVRVGFAFGR